MPRRPRALPSESVPLSVRELQQLNSVFGETDPAVLNPLRDIQTVNYSAVLARIGGELSMQDLQDRYRALACARGDNPFKREAADMPRCGTCGKTFEERVARAQLTFCVFHTNDEHVDSDPTVQRAWLCKKCKARVENMGLLLNSLKA